MRQQLLHRRGADGEAGHQVEHGFEQRQGDMLRIVELAGAVDGDQAQTRAVDVPARAHPARGAAVDREAEFHAASARGGFAGDRGDVRPQRNAAGVDGRRTQRGGQRSQADGVEHHAGIQPLHLRQSGDRDVTAELERRQAARRG